MTSLLLLVKASLIPYSYTRTTTHALLKVFTRTTPSFKHLDVFLNLAGQVVPLRGSEKLQLFLLKYPMRPQVGGLPHPMDHLHGVYASRKKWVHRVITVTQATLNGHALRAHPTKEEDLFNYHGNIYLLIQHKHCIQNSCWFQ